VSQISAFVIYAVMVGMLIWRPQGLFGRGVTR
jgi:branched-subunit amino acid ABC-type transport system permease component